MRFVVGDIHGEYEKLSALIKLIERENPAEIIFLGDYIDKGEKSKQVVDFLLELCKKYKCRFLKGNHEHLFLKALSGDVDAKSFLKKYGFKSTLESYIGKPLEQDQFEKIIDGNFTEYIPSEHIAFLKNTEHYIAYSDFIVVHAGIGVNENGEYDLDDENSLFFSRDNFLNTKMLFQNRKIVFGHTAFDEPFYDGFKLGIDTGAVYSTIPGYGLLSAVNLDKFEIINHMGEKTKPEINIGYEFRKYLEAVDAQLSGSGHQERLQSRINMIKDILAGNPVLFYGVGGSTHRLFEQFDFKGFNIQGYLDADQEKQGKFFQGKKIHSPDYLNRASINNIVICANESRFDIKKFLGSNFDKQLNIYLIYGEGEQVEIPIKDKIFALEKNLTTQENYKELIDLYLFVRDFKRSVYYIQALKKKFPTSNLFSEVFLNHLLSFPERIKKSFRHGPKSRLPNICLITIDTARSENMSCYGYQRDTTPFLSQLVKKSILCENSYSTSNWTIPSHGSIFTGQMPFDHGACTRFSKVLDSPEYLTRKLKEKNYGTYGWVNIPFLHPRYGFSSGFDGYHCIERWNYASKTFWEAFQKLPRSLPFFLFLNFIEAHDPYDCTHYKWGDASTDGEKMRRLYSEGKREIDVNLIRDTVNNYDDGILCVDQTLSYYMEAFPDNTVFIITSDHGELFGENKMYGHLNVTLHDGVTRVPLIIAGKNIKPQIVKRPVSIQEIYSIILELSDGSFSGIRENKEPSYIFSERKREVQSAKIDRHEFDNDVRVICDGKFKLMEYSDGLRKLFKLPDEDTNIIDQPENKAIATRLTQALHEKRGNIMNIKVNSLSDTNLDVSEKKKIEERLVALGYL